MPNTQITGRVELPDGTTPVNAFVRFQMSGFDTDAPDSVTIINSPIDAPIDASGNIDVDLWPNPDGVRVTYYRAAVWVRNAHASDDVYNLDILEVPTTGGPHTLNELLAISPSAPANPSIQDQLDEKADQSEVDDLEEKISEIAVASGNGPYATVADGLAATSDGEVFTAYDGVRFVGYKNNGGAAVELSSFASLNDTIIPFDTRAEFEAADIPSDVVRFTVAGLSYVVDPSGTAIESANGVKGAPDGRAFIEHWAENASAGVTDMTLAVQAAVDWSCLHGREVWGQRGVHFAITQKIVKPLTGTLRFRDVLLRPLASGFTNAIPAGRDGATGLVFDCSGELVSPFTPSDPVSWIGGGIDFESEDGRIVDALRLYNCASPELDDFTFRNSPCSVLVRIGSVTGTPRFGTLNFYNCTNSTDFGGSVSGQDVQITCVEVDNNIYNGLLSVPIVIRNINAEQVEQLGDAFTTYGPQTDVVNYHKGSFHHVDTINAYKVGEVVDVFAEYCSVGTINAREIITAFKCIHGANNNTAGVINCRDVYHQAVSFYGGTAGTGDTYSNHVEVLNIDRIDPTGVAGLTYTTAAVRTGDQGHGTARDNSIGKMTVTPANAKFLVLQDEQSYNLTVEGIKIEGGAVSERNYRTSNGLPYTIREVSETSVSLFNAASLNLPISTYTDLSFDTIIFDARSEWNASANKATLNVPALYELECNVRLSDVTSLTMEVLVSQGGVETLLRQKTADIAAQNHTISATFEVDLPLTDVRVRLLQGDGTRVLSGGREFNSLTIKRID